MRCTQRTLPAGSLRCQYLEGGYTVMGLRKCRRACYCYVVRAAVCLKLKRLLLVPTERAYHSWPNSFMSWGLSLYGSCVNYIYGRGELQGCHRQGLAGHCLCVGCGTVCC